jgi:CRP/FNR family cyclic AMP-dependent transcriptional regulator
LEVTVDLKELLRGVELFDGLNDSDLDDICTICKSRSYKKDDIITLQGETGDELFIVREGVVEVVRQTEASPPRVVLNLGIGQLIGEMSLVDQGKRSATVRAVQEPTIVDIIRRDDFHKLCERSTRIGYIVMRNIAADLSFKLRHRHLSEA